MNNAGTRRSTCETKARRVIPIFLAFNLAASIFGGNNARNEASNDAGTEIYILGVRYTTPHGSYDRLPSQILRGSSLV